MSSRAANRRRHKRNRRTLRSKAKFVKETAPSGLLGRLGFGRSLPGYPDPESIQRQAPAPLHATLAEMSDRLSELAAQQPSLAELAEMRKAMLPPWDPSMSDGCSFLPWLPLSMGRTRFQKWMLKWILPYFVTDIRRLEEICYAHDEPYYYGGTEDDRTEADLKWQDEVWKIDKTPDHWLARTGFVKIRESGGPEGRIPGVSWAWGGERFVYDEEVER